MRLQTVLHAIFPPACLCCEARVDTDFALCAACWAQTPFVLGTACDLCGVGLPGQSASGGPLVCEECHTIARPWSHGRAVLHYAGNGRKLVLGLKHGDRAEVARAAGPWMARAAADLLARDPLILPIPLHRWRLAQRRFNQSALLASALARVSGRDWLPDALVRARHTPTQDGRDRTARFANLDAAIRAAPRHAATLAGRNILLVDDVMTSGATFSAAAQACHAAGAEQVCVLALARVARDT
ncbi:double zinc ribbon domain-containing protein [Roseicyclus marinus]|uniref:double zinc ribbon domain-containing protein n=1 Tax=Roseicyclus marinus TaxID=2161673 RepID=UPI00240EA053|nr:double zinc ribbon domain-containing protein [Roseicyclus marinus]MDG3041553.1 double zinc ribbon domain-containing protein [Roseicyclus marinus]